jgi:hypothetical protein
MNRHTAGFAAALVLAALIVVLAPFCSWAANPPAATAVDEPFVGRWDLTLKGPDRDYPSWLEISEESGHLKARMVGRWGNARPLSSIELSAGELTFVSPKNEEGSPKDMVFRGRLSGKLLAGTVNGPDGKTWQWVGVKAPLLLRSGAPKWGKPITLFDGKDLAGWKTDTKAHTQWTVQDGTLVTPGHGPEIYSEEKFKDFKLHLEFNCGKDSNSGVYARGRYEVQIETDSAAEPVSHHTGGVYGFLDPVPEPPRRADAWQTYDITLIGRRITVVLNGIRIINDKEIPGITGGAVDSNEGEPGPIYLQGSEEGRVAFRNIVITPAE